MYSCGVCLYRLVPASWGMSRSATEGVLRLCKVRCFALGRVSLRFLTSFRMTYVLVWRFFVQAHKCLVGCVNKRKG